ncbi:dirigent protein 22 [Amborella trichopoda]|nr:dirigent protein 22 [Amborella trichopoda]|eukprot:XP_006841304.2 dirigent protein 22 [Amborella trichopoda]
MNRMASSLLSKTSCFSPLCLVIVLFFCNSALARKPGHLPRNQPPKFGFEAPMLGFRKEKVTHLHFYFHDIVSGPKPTAIQVARADSTNKSATGFGAIVMIDDPLTEGPEVTSKLIGRAQGIYASAAQEEVGLLMTLNYVFVKGKYKGSTLSILGRNAVFNGVREMAIVGGSGAFRLARGYALAKTYTFDLKTGDAVVEYNVVVLHY